MYKITVFQQWSLALPDLILTKPSEGSGIVLL